MEGVELLPFSWDQGQAKGQLISPGWSRAHQSGLLPQLPGGAVTFSLRAELPQSTPSCPTLSADALSQLLTRSPVCSSPWGIVYPSSGWLRDLP